MEYKLAKELQNAGFPQSGRGWVFNLIDDGPEYDEVWTTVEYPTIQTKAPTLAELIEACGEDFGSLYRFVDYPAWYAYEYKDTSKAGEHSGATAEEAVAELWLALAHKKNPY